MVTEEVEQIPVIPQVRLRRDPLGPSMGKRSHKCKNKEPVVPPSKDEETRFATILPPYTPLRSDDVPKVRIPNNAMFPLVAPKIPKGVWVMQNMLPNIKKMTFIDHDIHKFIELDMKNYMVVVQDTP